MSSVGGLRAQLSEDREAGLDFGTAWLNGLRSLPAPDRGEWFDTLRETARAWEAAYHQWPATRAEWALSAAGSDPDRELATGEPDPWVRACANCRGPIGNDKRSNARFCTRTCQRASHGRAE